MDHTTEHKQQQGRLRVVRQGLGESSISCPWCEVEMGPSVFAIQREGDEDALLLYHRCPNCQSLKAQGSADAFLEKRCDKALTDRISTRGQIECMSDFDTQCAATRLLANSSPDRLLDVGCGLGIGPDYAIHMLGAEAIGIDPSHDALSASRWLGHPLVNDFFHPEHPPVEGPFDLVQAWELIEHVDQPLAMLQSFKSLLSEQGYLCISTPAAEAAGADAADDDLLRLLAPPQHLHLFSAQALLGLLRRAGFGSILIKLAGSQLIVTAGSREPVFRTAEESRALFRSYLAQRADSLEIGNPFKLGFQSRRLSFALGCGDWDTVSLVLNWFTEEFERAWDLDLDDDTAAWRRLIEVPPNGSALSALPLCLTLVLFSSARLAQVRKNWSKAARCFLEAQAVGEFTNESLTRLGWFDGEIPLLASKAVRFRGMLPEEVSSPP